NVNSQVDPSLLRLGDCPPTQLSVNPQGSEAVFYAEFLTCNIRRLVTTNEIIFETEITSPTLSKATPIYYPVACAYEREEDWAPPLYDPLLFHTHGQGDLAFRMALMKDDFSGVATTTTFSLGSMIPIAASVAQQNHQPLILLLDECLASTTPELAPDSHVYPLITNKGYVCRQDVPFLKNSKDDSSCKTSAPRLKHCIYCSHHIVFPIAFPKSHLALELSGSLHSIMSIIFI
uniref:Zona pellucida glycoprotein 3f, tandem duplicate 1 n=1 Tax=Sinocyclocheilus rhinocerous TaxID=307959 RepID=A0A673IHR1_9TELE